MKSIRIRTANAAKMVAALKAAGFDATFRGPGTAYGSWNGGCSDPRCCLQHPGLGDPAWGTLVTSASGTQAHRVWVEAGIV